MTFQKMVLISFYGKSLLSGTPYRNHLLQLICHTKTWQVDKPLKNIF